MDLGPLLGSKTGAGTIGGMLAINLSGPRRIKAGAARDHALGVKAVSGRGEAFKAGGRVVKNVTGYDLPKLIAGSWGTLAVMTEITLKVLPAAEDVETVLALGLSDGRAIEAMSAAMGSACDVSGAVHLPHKIAGRMKQKNIVGANSSVTALRLEGIAPSIAYRREKLETMLRPFGVLAHLNAEESRQFWPAIRDALPSQTARKMRFGEFLQLPAMEHEPAAQSLLLPARKFFTTGLVDCFGWQCQARHRTKMRFALL